MSIDLIYQRSSWSFLRKKWLPGSTEILWISKFSTFRFITFRQTSHFFVDFWQKTWTQTLRTISFWVKHIISSHKTENCDLCFFFDVITFFIGKNGVVKFPSKIFFSKLHRTLLQISLYPRIENVQRRTNNVVLALHGRFWVRYERFMKKLTIRKNPEYLKTTLLVGKIPGWNEYLWNIIHCTKKSKQQIFKSWKSNSRFEKEMWTESNAVERSKKFEKSILMIITVVCAQRQQRHSSACASITWPFSRNRSIKNVDFF